MISGSDICTALIAIMIILNIILTIKLKIVSDYSKSLSFVFGNNVNLFEYARSVPYGVNLNIITNSIVVLYSIFLIKSVSCVNVACFMALYILFSLILSYVRFNSYCALEDHRSKSRLNRVGALMLILSCSGIIIDQYSYRTFYSSFIKILKCAGDHSNITITAFIVLFQFFICCVILMSTSRVKKMVRSSHFLAFSVIAVANLFLYKTGNLSNVITDSIWGISAPLTIKSFFLSLFVAAILSSMSYDLLCYINDSITTSEIMHHFKTKKERHAAFACTSLILMLLNAAFFVLQLAMSYNGFVYSCILINSAIICATNNTNAIISIIINYDKKFIFAFLVPMVLITLLWHNSITYLSFVFYLMSQSLFAFFVWKHNKRSCSVRE